MKAQIISGRFSEIVARIKSDADIQLGELLVCEEAHKKTILQTYDILYGSQISAQHLERISGLKLEDGEAQTFFNNNLRNYWLAKMKSILEIEGNKVSSPKSLPEFFSILREIKKEDVNFISDTKDKLFLGYLRSGKKQLDVDINLDGRKVLSHHILITGTTGRGKSVLMKNIIWSCAKQDYASLLVFDPHDEYYGRNNIGMKDYPEKNKVVYYTSKNVPAGQRSLKINLKMLRPDHFDFLNLSGPQRQVMYLYFKKHRENWIRQILLQDLEMSDMKNEINEMSLAVVRRRLKIILDIDVKDYTSIECSGIFDETSGSNTISDIIKHLEESKIIIVDTSVFSGSVELLVASMIASEALNKYKYYNTRGNLNDKPVINIVLEEAPRVIGKDVLEQGQNIFSSIAREGRKFKIGLSAITQLPSLIPKEILANINTKIILGTEMNSERQAIIESASQDLSTDDRAIASLDKGEAIITSTFTRFALPTSIPFFDERAKSEISKKAPKSSYSGLKE